MAQIHIGKKIKEVFDKSPMGVAQFARKIGKSRNTIYDIFERKTIQTGLLDKICDVFEHDFFYYLSIQQKLTRETALKNKAKKNKPA